MNAQNILSYMFLFTTNMLRNIFKLKKKLVADTLWKIKYKRELNFHIIMGLPSRELTCPAIQAELRLLKCTSTYLHTYVKYIYVYLYKNEFSQEGCWSKAPITCSAFSLRQDELKRLYACRQKSVCVHIYTYNLHTNS